MKKTYIDKLAFIDIKDKNLLSTLSKGKDVWYIPGGKPEGTVVRMTCYTAQFTGTLKASAEVSEYRYVDYSWKSKSSPVDQLIFDDLYAKGRIK